VIDPKKNLDLTDDVLRDEWEEIIFHHTATPRSSKYDVEWCRSFHVEQRGWSDIGYHLYIEHDGAISRGRPLNRIGAHCSNKNGIAIGIAVCGGMLADGSYGITLTDEQKQAMRECVEELRRRTGKDLNVSGHRDHKSTLCPLFEVKDVFDE
jgi:N-acetylmuramoyl-L-alanine amidase